MALQGTRDGWNCILVEVQDDEFDDVHVWTERLADSLKIWRDEGIRGVWLRLRGVKQARLIASTLERLNQFEYHHAQSGYCMLTAWLDVERPNSLPAYCSSHLGVGSVVVNQKRQILAVIDKGPHYTPTRWKLPGGAVDACENLGDAAEREVREETGIECHFKGLVAFRHMLRMRFDRGDLYFICLCALPQPETDESLELTPCPDEIAHIAWMDLDEFLEFPHVKNFVRPFRDQLVAAIDGHLAAIVEQNSSQVTPGIFETSSYEYPSRSKSFHVFYHASNDEGTK